MNSFDSSFLQSHKVSLTDVDRVWNSMLSTVLFLYYIHITLALLTWKWSET